MLRFAFRNLMSRPTRSVLSLLGLTVAIAGMVGLFSVARGIDRMISQTFDDIPGLIVMQPGAPIPLFSRLPADWGREMAQVPGVSVVNPELWQRVNMIDGKMIVSPPRLLCGVDISRQLLLKRHVFREHLLTTGPYAGRFLDPDRDIGTLNVLVSRQIAEEFGKGVGDTLRINGHDMTIVGVYHHGSLLVDVNILVDIGRLREITRFDPNTVSAYYIELEESADTDEVAERIRDLFRGRKAVGWQPAPVFEFGSDGSGNPLIDFFRRLDSGLKSRTPADGSEQANQQTTQPSNDAAKDSTDENKHGRPALDAAQPPNSGRDVGNANAHRPPPGSVALSRLAENGPHDSGDSRQTREFPGRTPAGTDGEVSDSAADADANLPLEVRSASELGEKFDEIAGDLDFILAVLTGIGVTIAVLSIVNTMLMSVSERIIEFGILKANGWSQLDVLKLITFESAILGLSGGILGSTFGRLATDFINWKWPTRADLYASPGLLAFGVAFAAALGILGGLYPAVWAMRMMPMDAIRRG